MSGEAAGWCEGCRWWGAERSHQEDRPWGRCRRTPPIFTVPSALTTRDFDTGLPSQPMMVSRGEWPWVAFDDWCGGFEPRPTTPTNTDTGEGA